MLPDNTIFLRCDNIQVRHTICLNFVDNVLMQENDKTITWAKTRPYESLFNQF